MASQSMTRMYLAVELVHPPEDEPVNVRKVRQRVIGAFSDARMEWKRMSDLLRELSRDGGMSFCRVDAVDEQLCVGSELTLHSQIPPAIECPTVRIIIDGGTCEHDPIKIDATCNSKNLVFIQIADNDGDVIQECVDGSECLRIKCRIDDLAHIIVDIYLDLVIAHSFGLNASSYSGCLTRLMSLKGWFAQNLKEVSQDGYGYNIKYPVNYLSFASCIRRKRGASKELITECVKWWEEFLLVNSCSYSSPEDLFEEIKKTPGIGGQISKRKFLNEFEASVRSSDRYLFVMHTTQAKSVKNQCAINGLIGNSRSQHLGRILIVPYCEYPKFKRFSRYFSFVEFWWLIFDR